MVTGAGSSKKKPGTPRAQSAAARASLQEDTGLRFIDDSTPGIRRRKAGVKFRYLSPDGKAVRDAKVLARIRSLAIPPAYTDVWISPIANSYLQATGRDARGRKQYRYHPQWRAWRDANKYHRVIAFGKALPKIRRRVQHDLQRRGLGREEDFSAKDFRTWAGTVLMAEALRVIEQFSSPRQAKRNIVKAIKSVSALLGNTPAICRRCYVHPGVIEAIWIRRYRDVYDAVHHLGLPVR